MGYDLHITRRENWFDEDAAITREEWLAYVKDDPEMRQDGFAEASVGGETFRIVGEDICVWTAYSGGDRGNDMCWITWSEGTIDAKNPDQEIRQKLWAIAQALDAKVQGDDLEVYGEDGEIVQPRITGAAPPPPSANPKRSWWRFW